MVGSVGSAGRGGAGEAALGLSCPGGSQDRDTRRPMPPASWSGAGLIFSHPDKLESCLSIPDPRAAA